ncbi:hypothetical protein BEWA_027500 [Theileria equi strain WA]|uniref:Uncharacterized protein n=1 Tax=Theileria equi strain WA TaxID=1537102 RepID=L0AY33_THEEQ|nr:hypothetical protein BEWA_027500 [Theileria equi strain WA]AFZ79901.1 hypothetical protein BEWA_027500 [Theileria equi strain WA]|eukprot:XP_004829567.1 hypothetical protein BEWA_027500 [Theileria equi strain WA]
MSKDLQKGAMFMAGLTLLQSLRVALTGAKFALDRFKIPQQHASSFINMVHNPMELATFTGMAIVTSIALGTGDSSKDFFRGFAAFTNVALCLSFIILLIAFTSGGQMGNLTFYYWTIVFGSFIYGLNVAAVMTVASADASLFNMGIPISGIQVCIYYYVFNKLAKRYNFSNVSYWIIFWQMSIGALISAASAGLWIYLATQQGSSEAGAPGKYTGFAGLSPIFMGMVGMGGIYAFYPAIAPYKLTDVSTGYTIDLVVLFMSAVPGILIAILCACNGGPPGKGVGPNQDWSSAQWWHGTWILAIPHITAMVLCLVTLHYPDTWLGKYIKSSGTFVGVITVTLKFCEESLKAVSYAGAGAHGGAISSFNAFTSQGLMIVLAFTGDGYLKTYSKYEHDRSRWPTKDFGFWKSLGYWIGSGVSEACKSVKSSFTKNVRCKVLGKSEALLIVYADQEF